MTLSKRNATQKRSRKLLCGRRNAMRDVVAGALGRIAGKIAVLLSRLQQFTKTVSLSLPNSRKNRPKQTNFLLKSSKEERLPLLRLLRTSLLCLTNKGNNSSES